jgi:hypothetical protein
VNEVLDFFHGSNPVAEAVRRVEHESNTKEEVAKRFKMHPRRALKIEEAGNGDI